MANDKATRQYLIEALLHCSDGCEDMNDMQLIQSITDGFLKMGKAYITRSPPEPEQILVPFFGCICILTEDNALFRRQL